MLFVNIFAVVYKYSVLNSNSVRFFYFFMTNFNFVFNMSPKIVYLFGVFVNILTMNIIKYAGLNGILTISEIICLRTTFAMFLLLPFNIKEFSKIKTNGKIDKKIALYLLILGIIAGMSSYFWNIGLQTVPVNNAMILLFLSPIITAFISHLMLGEEITKKIKLSFVINSFAVFLIYRFSFNGFSIGYLLIFGDFLIYAFVAILIKKLQIFSSNFLVFIRLLILLPFSWIVMHKVPDITGTVTIFISMITVGYIIERTCITLAFKKIPIAEVQPLRYFNLVFSAILSFLILSEPLTKWQVIGISIIVFGAFIIRKVK